MRAQEGVESRPSRWGTGGPKGYVSRKKRKNEFIDDLRRLTEMRAVWGFVESLERIHGRYLKTK